MKQSWFWFVILYTTLVFSITSEPALGLTDPADVSALQSFLKGIKNADVLNWSGDDPCGGKWRYVKCIGNSVVAIEAGSGNLQGTVAPEINSMKHLISLQLQDNKFTGSLPSLSGLSWLTEAYFGGNSFDTIPTDFFVGLANLTSLYLENNQLNGTGGWTLPDDLAQCSQLTALSLTNTNLYGGIPDYLGNMTSLQKLYLAYNHLQGGIPSSFAGSRLVVFQANNQQGPLLGGSIHAVGSMQNLEKLWLQVNLFSGTIPPGLGNVAGLQDLKLNDNQFVGTIPESLTSLLALQNISVKNNRLVGAIPGFRTSVNLEYDGNKFCNDVPGVPCSPDVSALLTFIGTANGYTSSCVSNWENGDPCKGGWSGVICQPGTNNVSVLNLPKCQLNGKISSAIANLSSLTTLKLQNNGLRGTIPIELTKMPSLITVDLSYNNLSGPFPTFPASVKANLQGNQAAAGPSPSAGSGGGNTGTTGQPSGFSNSSNGPGAAPESSSSVHVGAIVGPIVAVVAVAMAGIAVYYYCRKKRQGSLRVPSSRTTVVVHPRDSGSDREAAKTVPLVNLNVANNGRNSGPSEVHVDTGNLAISIQVLRKATNGFNEDSILGRGGFGVVYKGQLEDGTLIAVKRMQASAVTNKALTEFQAEIGVLTKVRHRHLVALLGYCVEAGERLLVYEYMPQGTLCQHLFEYEKYNHKPLSWKQRLVVALDVARGLEYLHGLAHKSFIHRDLKPSNILLGDDMRAKVSDFGLVKLAPEGKFSIETRVAGTFGYLAPEYAVTGRVTTKVDVYSFGVVLMELITGRRALDDTQPEENMHLVTWFRRMVNNRETFMASLDKNIEITDETFQSISTVAQLAGHCTHREPHQRPDMSHAVNVLGPMVERWKPSVDFDAEGSAGIDLGLSLPEALRRWQELECTATIDDTQSSIPPRSAEPGQMDLLR